MPLSARAVALEGVGFAPLLLALQGFVAPAPSAPATVAPSCLSGSLALATTFPDLLMATTCLDASTMLLTLASASSVETSASAVAIALVTEADVDDAPVTLFPFTLEGCHE